MAGIGIMDWGGGGLDKLELLWNLLKMTLQCVHLPEHNSVKQDNLLPTSPRWPLDKGAAVIARSQHDKQYVCLAM